MVGDGDALAAVILPIAAAGDGIGVSALAIGAFQKLDVVYGWVFLLEILIDTEFLIPADGSENVIDRLLRQGKSIFLVRCRLRDQRQLLMRCRSELFAGVEPLAEEHHAIDAICHLRPAHEVLSFTGEVIAAPEVQNVSIGAITGALVVAQDFLDKGIVKERANEIAAFLAVLMDGKECGNLCSMLF